MTDFITTNLRLELDATNQALQRWTDKQRDTLEFSDSKFSQMMEEFDCTINALKDNELQLEDLRAKNDLMKMKQAQEIQSYSQQIESLKEDKLDLKKEIAIAADEERSEMTTLQSVREDHEKARVKAERSLDDLTYGIKMYMNLGLEFQKCDGECMKFIFSNIDPAIPEKKFYFLIS